MPARHAVLLTAPKADVRLALATPLESTLVEVFVLNSLNPFKMNTFGGVPHFAQFLCNVTPFRINTCKSVSKQTTLSTFRINTYEKQGEGGGSPQTVNSPFRKQATLSELLFFQILAPYFVPSITSFFHYNRCA